MGHLVARLAPAVVLVGGCSLIYNPNSIDRPTADARIIDMGGAIVDVEIRADASPSDMMLTEAYPPTILEGAGTGEARKAVVVLRGMHFVRDASANLTVTITPETPDAATLESFEVSGSGDYIGLALTVPVDETCGDGSSVKVDVTVSQNDGSGGVVTGTLDDAFTITCLDELTSAPASANGLKAMYSKIEIAGALDFPAAMASAAILRSASFISITGAVDASATGRNPGPGGAVGGGQNAAGAGLRPGGGAASGGGGHGGGGGFLTAGTAGSAGGLGGAGGGGGGVTGDPWLSRYNQNASSGGGGGGSTLTGTGGAGGGGGGTLELTARGDVSIGAVTAHGGAGGAGSNGGGAGGAGTGGVILIRAGHELTATTVSVTRGAKTGSGGASSDGRIRIDAAKGNYPTGGTPCVVPFAPACNVTYGPMLVDLPTTSRVQMTTVHVRGTPNDETATLRVLDTKGMAVPSPTNMPSYTPAIGNNGDVTMPVVLRAGYNKICVWVAGGGLSLLESVNCEEIAYLPD